MTRQTSWLGNGVLISVSDLFEKVGSNIITKLMNAGVCREIDLLFEVPRGQKVVLMPNQYYFNWKERIIGVPPSERTPEYLVLLPEMCEQLKRAKFVEVMDAECAYRKVSYTQTGEATQLLKTLPVHAANSPVSPVQIENLSGTNTVELPEGMQWERWALKPNQSMVWHRVHVEDLFVITEDFLRWMGWEANSEASHEFFFGRSTSRSSEDIEDDFKSPQLLRMCEASMKLWGNKDVKSHDPSTHPSNQLVIEWLLASNSGFTKTSAENAAALIKPAFGLRAGGPENKGLSSRKKF